jgi:hypothetical protein
MTTADGARLNAWPIGRRATRSEYGIEGTGSLETETVLILEELLFKTQTDTKPEMIGYCPGCDQPITESQPTRLVLGQLYHAAHAPRVESGK